jgi:polysaccharide pyruvyl transferase WcaK-like protein
MRPALISLNGASHSREGEFCDQQDGNGKKARHSQPKIAAFGHFGAGNFGNESTLQAILFHLGRLMPDAEISCICTSPETVAADYRIAGLPMSWVVVKPWNSVNPAIRLVRKLLIGMPSELYRWLKGFVTLRKVDVFIIPGTGLLTDAYSLVGWGPYSTFKWSVIAKLCRCKLLFVSVGAGPVYSRIGRFFVKAALSVADFRSYRDEPTQRYLKGIGFPADNDNVYPDLVFSLPEDLIPRGQDSKGQRLVVGIGLMEYAGRYSVDRPTNATYAAYLETLVEFVKWLLVHDCNVRLLIGDLVDTRVTREFRSLLNKRSVALEEGRIIDEPASSLEDVLKQLAATDLVVATRFHNVLLSLLLNKPAIAISFHHKCSSLMSQMGLSEYCQDINGLNADKLIEQFRDLEKNAESLKPLIKQKAEEFRRVLDEQYNCIFKVMQPGRHMVSVDVPVRTP